MKKILLTFIIGLTLISCKKEDVQPNQPTPQNTGEIIRLTKDGQVYENSTAVYYSYTHGIQGLSPNQLDTIGIWQPQSGWYDVDTSMFIQINVYDTPSNSIHHYKVEYIIEQDTTVLYELWSNPDYQIVIQL